MGVQGFDGKLKQLSSKQELVKGSLKIDYKINAKNVLKNLVARKTQKVVRSTEFAVA